MAYRPLVSVFRGESVALILQAPLVGCLPLILRSISAFLIMYAAMHYLSGALQINQTKLLR